MPARNQHVEKAPVASEERELTFAHDALRPEAQLTGAIGRDAGGENVAGGVEVFDQIEQGHALFPPQRRCECRCDLSASDTAGIYARDACWLQGAIICAAHRS